ncbi:ThuA domain-containing protein [Fulvivirgaceae bacterium BMA10]|uniref:ThuA domain-containing protein n=1 Tax=Splendidivirga corallicola TaxID=3051826 RepID=A0ABT8KNC9_9BACT|nr:ThuA domain-containing protein [Fulvivirgaceae bacterium BMA10]
MIKLWIFTFCLVAIFCDITNAQNRYYDYRNRVPGDKTHILYISGDDTHGSLEVAAVLRKFLEVRHNYFMTYTEDYSVLTRSLEKFDVILMNNIPPKLTEEEMLGLTKAIEEGKPFLGIHAISATYKMDQPQKKLIFDIIGAEFIRHPPIHEFKVNITQPDTDITMNLPDFDIYDEMYFFKSIKPDINILMTSTYEGDDVSGQDWENNFGKSKSTPVTWTRKYGKGKVFYTSLGHSIGAVTNRYFQQVILNGLLWLTAQEEK